MSVTADNSDDEIGGGKTALLLWVTPELKERPDPIPGRGLRMMRGETQVFMAFRDLVNGIPERFESGKYPGKTEANLGGGEGGRGGGEG